MGIRHDAMYLRLVRQADGVAVGHTAMPRSASEPAAGDAGFGAEQYHAVRDFHREDRAGRSGDERVGGIHNRVERQGQVQTCTTEKYGDRTERVKRWSNA